ncbi:MAG: GNAT family protein [Planctomycetota bacterium]|nr:GNAT family protein [Planctomycetota bacterium]
MLRWWEPADAPALRQAVDSDRAALLPWLPWARASHADEAASRATIDYFTARRAEGLDFTVGAFDRVTGAVVGGSGLHRLAPELHEAELGYWVRGSLHRQGLAVEMTRALLTAAFTDFGLRRIRICCAGGNRPSQLVLEKIGVRLEGRSQESRWTEGLGWDDHLEYAVLTHEWDPTRSALRVSAG